MKKKVILSSVVTIALCLSLIAGSTYALFTDKEVVGVEVTAGKVDIVATLNKDVATTTTLDSTYTGTNVFQLGGTATLNNNVLVLDRMVPGDAATVTLDVENKSNVATKYKVRVYIEDGENSNLSEVLVSTVAVNGVGIVTLEDNTSTTEVETDLSSSWIELPLGEGNDGEDIGNVAITVAFPNSTADQNMYQSNTAKVYFQIIAVQGNGNGSYADVNETDTTAVAP